MIYEQQERYEYDWSWIPFVKTIYILSSLRANNMCEYTFYFR